MHAQSHKHPWSINSTRHFPSALRVTASGFYSGWCHFRGSRLNEITQDAGEGWKAVDLDLGQEKNIVLHLTACIMKRSKKCSQVVKIVIKPSWWITYTNDRIRPWHLCLKYSSSFSSTAVLFILSFFTSSLYAAQGSAGHSFTLSGPCCSPGVSGVSACLFFFFF